MMAGRAGSYPEKAWHSSRRWLGHARRWLPSAVLLPVCLYVLARRGAVAGVDQLNFLIHEAGHLLFFALGDLWHAAGGTLMQVLVPALLVGHFWRFGLPLGVQVSLLWLGQNALDVSTYAADARTQTLALLPGRSHDWAHLLDRLDLLAYDALIAYLFCVGAMLCFIAAVVWPLWRPAEASA